MLKFRVSDLLLRLRGISYTSTFGPWLRLSWILLALVFCGCAAERRSTSERPFVFKQDSFAFANELVWEYRLDPASGQMTHARRELPPTYSHRCFVMARSARQFFQHAQFDPTLPAADEATYRRLVREVISSSPRREAKERILIPGYANLHAFSEAHEALLKSECGGAWQSYFQRGHWRMIFPFSGHHQERMSMQLTDSIGRNGAVVVHVVCFPRLSINHAVVLFDSKQRESEVDFDVYDPNRPEEPAQLIYDRVTRRFLFPANPYFAGGRVDVYEVYCAWNY
jgi:hypothetical protein